MWNVEYGIGMSDSLTGRNNVVVRAGMRNYLINSYCE